MKALVVGATGFMGRETARLLLDAGWQVRAMTRTPDKAADLKALGADVVPGDLTDPPSLARACDGMFAVVDAAHAIMGKGPYSSAAVDDTGKRALVDAAKAAGVEHFVFTSMQGVSPGHPVDFIRYKAALEQYVEASGMTYTVLRPPAFMEWHAHIFLGKGILEQGKTSILGKGQDRQNFMSANDVAKYAVIALTDPRAANRVLEIGGPDNLTKNDVAAMYMRLSGRQAKVSHLPRPVMRVMSVALKPVQPGVARIMKMAYYNEGQDQSYDASKILAEFPVAVECLEDFVKARVDEWKKVQAA